MTELDTPRPARGAAVVLLVLTLVYSAASGVSAYTQYRLYTGPDAASGPGYNVYYALWVGAAALGALAVVPAVIGQVKASWLYVVGVLALLAGSADLATSIVSFARRPEGLTAELEETYLTRLSSSEWDTVVTAAAPWLVLPVVLAWLVWILRRSPGSGDDLAVDESRLVEGAPLPETLLGGGSEPPASEAGPKSLVEKLSESTAQQPAVPWAPPPSATPTRPTGEPVVRQPAPVPPSTPWNRPPVAPDTSAGINGHETPSPVDAPDAAPAAESEAAAVPGATPAPGVQRTPAHPPRPVSRPSRTTTPGDTPAADAQTPEAKVPDAEAPAADATDAETPQATTTDATPAVGDKAVAPEPVPAAGAESTDSAPLALPTSPPPAPLWYVLVIGATYGPYPWDQMREFAAEGRITETTLVRQGEDGPIVPLSQVLHA